MTRHQLTTSLIIIGCMFCFQITHAQKPTIVSPTTTETLPAWAIEMYGPNPNIWRVDDGYRLWRKSNPTAATTFTQYYKKWRRELTPYINTQGYEQRPTAAEQQAFAQRLDALKKDNPRNAAPWSVVGPIETFNTNTGANPLAKSSQVNIYSFDQTRNAPHRLYCGTEGGEIYVSNDKGLSWQCVSYHLDIGAPTAIESFSDEHSIVFFGESNRLWFVNGDFDDATVVLEEPGMEVHDIKASRHYDGLILAATQTGLYRSISGGSEWVKVISTPCYDVEYQTDYDSTVFAVCHDPADNICRFYKSTDFGETWTVRPNGWYFSDDPGRNNGGARLAVSDADPNRVYAVLIGEAKAGDDGFIGIYRSDDGGETWTLPNPPAGGPYDDNMHPNMATIGRTGGYHQGFYNLGFDASDSNPDELLVGFLNLWKSTDGAFTWSCMGGYCHNDFNYVHPDCQEIEINGDDVWITSDGGIEYSNDFFQTHYARNRGITASDYWGFGQGWNDDVMVGGRYHNGNSGQYESWLPGESLSLGGGEAATGYVNPGPGLVTYHSDLGRVDLPEEQNGYVHYKPLGKAPNESYYDAESGEMEWDPRCWNTFFVTNENKIWKTEDGGVNWSVLHEFGPDVNARALAVEISRSNPDVMYLFQRNANWWDPGKLWTTTNGGLDWNEISLPQGYARRCVMALDPEDEQRLWVAYPDAGDNEKIWVTPDGGGSWLNRTTPALNTEHITAILAQGGTNDGIYLGTFRTIWFKDDSMNEWMPYNEGLPARIGTCILRPFYRDSKIRLGAYGKSIWEAPFAVNGVPVAQPMANKRVTSCPQDTILFDDYSMLAHAGATWQWEFPGGTPSTSTLRNPKVSYAAPGDFDVTLTVANPAGSSTKTVQGMITVMEPEIHTVPPAIDFSNTEYFTVNNPDNGITWVPVELNECDPQGDTAYMVNNYEYSSYGQDEIVLPINMDLTNAIDPKLKFRVAYAPYYDGNAFIDSLHVLISYNCGQTFDYLLRIGGEALSTTTSGEGPNNLYEYQVFRPAHCEEWRHMEIDLDAYIGHYVTIKFLNKSGYGNQMYLDDIAVEAGFVSTEEWLAKHVIEVKPNPTSGQFTVSRTRDDGHISLVTITNAEGQRMFTRKSNGPVVLPITFNLGDSAPGVYYVNVEYKDGRSVVEKVVKE